MGKSIEKHAHFTDVSRAPQEPPSMFIHRPATGSKELCALAAHKGCITAVGAGGELVLSATGDTFTKGKNLAADLHAVAMLDRF